MSDTRTVLLPRRARLPTTDSMRYRAEPSVVVVHSCLRQALIRHERGASLADVGL